MSLVPRPLAIVTFTWWALVVALPAWLANRAFARGRRALAAKSYEQAEQWLKQAAARPDLKSKALCLIAQCAIRAGRPRDAIFALDEISDRPSPHVHFLRGIACTALRQGPSAQQTFAALTDVPDPSPEHLLGMLHAALVSGDLDTAESLLERIPAEHFAGPLAARLQLCRAAFCWARADHLAALAALPDAAACSPADQMLVGALRKALEESKACPACP